MKLIKDKEVQYVDLRFNDLRGKMQHVTFDVTMIDTDIFTEGTMFDGSSIAGWKAINESDMVMRPDPMRRAHRSVLPADHARDVLRHSRARHAAALLALPALASPRRRKRM